VTKIAGRFAGTALALFLLTAGSVALAAPAAASSAAASSIGLRSGVQTDVDDFTFSDFSADYYLDRDASGHSTLKTVEKLTAEFPSSDQNKGIVRKIPDDYLGSSLHTKFVSVSDTNGVTTPYSVNDDGTNTTVETGTDDYVHGAVTYTLTYTQSDVVGQFSDTNDQEFYWDTNGSQWTQPFSTLTARVHVPASLVPALSGHNACYQGAQGSSATCEISAPTTASSVSPVASPTPDASATPSDGIFTATATGLAAGENMTVAIGFVNGTFTAAPHADSGTSVDHARVVKDTVWGEVVGGILLLLGLASIPFALIRRFAFGQRDAKGRGTIIPQYDVPPGMNLLEAGTIAGREAFSVPAQIVSFAVRGMLRILDYPVTASGASYTLELTTDAGLDPEEESLMGLFFPVLTPGSTFEIVPGAVSSTEISAIRANVHSGLVQKGWRTKASSRAGALTGLALLGLFIIDIVIITITGGASVLADIAIPITFVAMIVAFATAYRGYVLTPAGADQRDYLLGMKLYLTVAEEDRLRILQSPTGAERVDYGDKREVVKLYEKLLPFAVLFGVENEWSKVLALHYTDVAQNPDWFVSNNAFNAVIFASTFSNLSSAVSSSVIPVSSGGGSSFGGSFGGGFSGGGGGGGGGGGR
jgi:uncharacterized membrane protein YgcG/uncharacterized membrane protein YphA (DoxX/SURF4 family)